MPESQPLSPDSGPVMDPSFSNPVAYQLHLSFQASQALQQEAQAALEAHQQAAESYNQALEQPDFSPFVSLPNGTETKDLANGERLFVLPDGAFLQTTPATHFLFVDQTGVPYQLSEIAGFVSLPDGRRFELVASARGSHTLDWIEGLPASVQPVQVDDARFRLVFPNELRLEVSVPDRTAVVIDPNGSVLVLGKGLQAYADQLTINLLKNGGRGFAATRAGHRGFVEQNGDILLSLATGEDLVIHFPKESDGPSDLGTTSRFYSCGVPV